MASPERGQTAAPKETSHLLRELSEAAASSFSALTTLPTPSSYTNVLEKDISTPEMLPLLLGSTWSSRIQLHAFVHAENVLGTEEKQESCSRAPHNRAALQSREYTTCLKED
jgi:hypothetical protein